MLQSTQNVSVVGAGEVSSLTFYTLYVGASGLSDKYLGLGTGTGTGYAQHYLMTNEHGNLEGPAQEPQGASRGGMVTWTDPYPSIWGAKVYRAGWDVR